VNFLLLCKISKNVSKNVPAANFVASSAIKCGQEGGICSKSDWPPSDRSASLNTNSTMKLDDGTSAAATSLPASATFTNDVENLTWDGTS